jgi:membrane protein implicated in regulation of membrane protease activity
MMIQAIAVMLLITGLGVGVKVAFFGVERRRGGEIRRPHAAINLPAAAAAMVAWGAVGYALSRGGVRLSLTILFASVASALAWVGMGTLLAMWALRAPLHDPHELAEILQGHVAVVLSTIGTVPGTISYQLHGESHVVSARSIGGEPIEAGTDVVIDRIEDGVAYVEPWALVEQRL